MRLIWNNNRFEFISSFSEKDLIKKSGFKWDGRVWWTMDPDKAAHFQNTSAEAEEKIVELRQLQQQNLVASQAVDSNIVIPVPKGLAYRNFQRAGVDYIIRNSNCLLADMMGLGKTVQTIGTINTLGLDNALIVCPANARNVWVEHLEHWLFCRIPFGVARSIPQRSNGKTKLVPTFPDTPIVIVGKDVLHQYEAYIKARTWSILIVDEIHNFRNMTARMTKLLFGYIPTPKEIRTAVNAGLPPPTEIQPIKSLRRLYLSGTPIVNYPIEFFPALHSLRPDLFPNKWSFAMKYCGAKQKKIYVKGGPKLVWDIKGSSNEQELNHILRSNLMIRRTKEQVLPELPPKIHQWITLEPTADQELAIRLENEAVDNELLAELKADQSVDSYTRIRGKLKAAFSQMSKVREDVGVAKVPSIVEFVKDLLDNQDTAKIAVWLHHHKVVDAVKAALESYGMVSIIGGDSDKHRREAGGQFQNNPLVRVFVGSIQAAGTAITLTATSVAVFGEQSWVPGDMSQAADRHHRIGQANSVLIYYLILRGSLDHRISEVFTGKEEIHRAILR